MGRTAGRVPGGGLVQASQRASLPSTEHLLLALSQPDFVTARRLADVINEELQATAAWSVDSASVAVKIPAEYANSVADLMARLEPLALDIDTPARVVVNERTGTVVVGAGVRLSAAAVAHGNLSVRISTRYNVSQPAPFSERGQTVVVPEQQVDVEESDARLVELAEGTTLESVVRALNSLGATPRDIIAIMQALKAAGALRAELVII
ncbi:MAG: flgI [Acidobacteria bacterium]|nr:flgI [Acidobacteriota bacterium]